MIRTGIGYDIHPFDAQRTLVLGGVVIPDVPGLAGHSDADVLLHAIADALLGAIAFGDIGHLFPPSDPALAGIDSRVILRAAAERVRLRGFVVLNIDSTIIAERPRIAPYIEAMQKNIAEDVQVARAGIGIKATTNEGLGAVGRGEGIAALAIVTIADKRLLARL